MAAPSLDVANAAPSRETTRPSGLRPEQRERVLAYGLIAPAALAVLLLIIYPLLRVIELSFRQGRMMNFARLQELPLGLGNYSRILSDHAFWHSVFVSAVYVGASVGAALLVGLVTALLLNGQVIGRRVFRTLVLLPWAVPGVVASIVFLWLLDGSFGVVNAVLRDLGLLESDQAWFVERRTALLAVIIPTVWKAYPLITLMLLAAMQSIPDTLYEAARIDGAGPVQEFRYVTWPAIQATAVLAVLVSALWIFRDIDIVFATTRGGPSRSTETLALYVYNEAFQYFRMGTAAAAGSLMVAAAFVFAIAAIGLARRDRF